MIMLLNTIEDAHTMAMAAKILNNHEKLEASSDQSSFYD